LFSLGQLENFVWTWQVCFILDSFFASLSFVLFAKSIDATGVLSSARVKPLLFVYSLVAALLATLSAASGLFVWPVLIYLCLVLRLNWRNILATILSAVVVVGSYLVN
jgi:hypothetical protein